MPASPVDAAEAAEATDAAREGAREGTAVGTSSVAPTITGKGPLGREKTRSEAGGRLDEGDGARADLPTAGVS